ncbi:MAG: hypothetical protein Q9164_000611 [Protoblastenia rupestris]
MAPQEGIDPAEGITKPIAKPTDMETARTDRKLVVQAYGDFKPRSIPQNLAKLLSARWNELLQIPVSNTLTLMHDEKAVRFMTQRTNAGGIDPPGPNTVRTQAFCPCPPARDDGYWCYNPANLKAISLNVLGDNNPLATVQRSEGSVSQQPTAAAEPRTADQPLEKSSQKFIIQVTGLSGKAQRRKGDFAVNDQNGITWFIPRPRVHLTVEGLTEGDKLRLSGIAPFEYAWYGQEEPAEKTPLPPTEKD